MGAMFRRSFPFSLFFSCWKRVLACPGGNIISFVLLAVLPAILGILPVEPPSRSSKKMNTPQLSNRQALGSPKPPTKTSKTVNTPQLRGRQAALPSSETLPDQSVGASEVPPWVRPVILGSIAVVASYGHLRAQYDQEQRSNRERMAFASEASILFSREARIILGKSSKGDEANEIRDEAEEIRATERRIADLREIENQGVSPSVGLNPFTSPDGQIVEHFENSDILINGTTYRGWKIDLIPDPDHGGYLYSVSAPGEESRNLLGLGRESVDECLRMAKALIDASIGV